MLYTDFNDRLEKLKKRIGVDNADMDYQPEEDKKTDINGNIKPELEEMGVQVMLLDVPVKHNIFTNTEDK